MAFERFNINNNRGTSSFKGERPGVYGIPSGISIGSGARNPRLPGKPGVGAPPLGGPLPPFQGLSVSAGPVTPGAGPIGGTMFPGGERPGTYGVPAPGGSATIGNEFNTGTVPMPTPGPGNYYNPRFPRPNPPGAPGGSVNAGPQAPGGSPLGGTMVPGGERPGTYGVKPGSSGGKPFQGNKGPVKAPPAPWQETGRFQGLDMPAWTFRRSGVKRGNGKTGKNPPPSNDKPTVPGTSQPPGTQWGNPTAPFPQNPYDVPAPLNPANNPWLASLPQRDWMTMPSASPGYDQAPPQGPWRPPY